METRKAVEDHEEERSDSPAAGRSDDSPERTVTVGVSTLAQEDPKQILRTRARELARVPDADGTGKERLGIVVFRLADELYAVESQYVREVIPLKGLTSVPCTPPFVLGILNVRGEILSVLDFKKFFELPDTAITDDSKIVIVQSETMEFGVLADEVLGAQFMAVDAFKPALMTLAGVRGDYVKGVTQDQLVLLDGHIILNDKRLVVAEEVSA
jgi:purine-binding chemotaxis protein CheW